MRACLYFTQAGTPAHYGEVVAVRVEQRNMVGTLFHSSVSDIVGINGPKPLRPLQVSTTPDDYTTLQINAQTTK